MENASQARASAVLRIASVRNDPAKRTLYVRLSGEIDLATMRACCDAMKRLCDSYQGAPHVCVADMRGLQPVFGPVAEVLGEGIGYCRAHGVVRCAHLSDHAVIKLQAANLARAATPDDAMTINVVSVAEAERVVAEELVRLEA